MLYIILDTVVDIWNKTDIKLPTSQLEILRENKASLACYVVYIEVTSWLVSADDFSSRVARGANERVSAANE